MDKLKSRQIPFSIISRRAVSRFSQFYFTPGLTVFSPGCYSQNSRRGSSVVEQPIRNRQVVGSTPTLGSIL